MEPAIDRIMMTYDLLLNRSAAASAEARAKVTDYVTKLFEAGEKDMHRLTVCGLTYLRELDGSRGPVQAGYTGLCSSYVHAACTKLINPCDRSEAAYRARKRASSGVSDSTAA